MLYFIVNHTARTGACIKVWKEAEELIKKQGLEYRVFRTDYEGHATELAARICGTDDADICIIVVGGDGTVNEVLNGITDFSRIRLGLIPAGSGNDFGRGIQIKRRNMVENVERIVRMYSKGPDGYTPMDLGQVLWENETKSRFFGISSGVGMDALVSKKALRSKMKVFLNRLHIGKLTYLLLTVETLFSMRTAEFCMSCEGMETVSFQKGIFLAAMNMFAEGGGVPMAPKATPYDGLLSVCCASGIPKWRTFLCLPLLVMAKHEKLKGFSLHDAKEVHVTVSEPMTLHADGEYCGDVTDVTFRCLKDKVHFLI